MSIYREDISDEAARVLLRKRKRDEAYARRAIDKVKKREKKPRCVFSEYGRGCGNPAGVGGFCWVHKGR